MTSFWILITFGAKDKTRPIAGFSCYCCGLGYCRCCYFYFYCCCYCDICRPLRRRCRCCRCCKSRIIAVLATLTFCLTDSPQCRKDKFVVAYKAKFRNWCGKSSNASPATYDGDISFIFKTDSSGSGRGFMLIYKLVDESDQGVYKFTAFWSWQKEKRIRQCNDLAKNFLGAFFARHFASSCFGAISVVFK